MDCAQINALAEKLLGKAEKEQVENMLSSGRLDPARSCLLRSLVKSRVTNNEIFKACQEVGLSKIEAANVIEMLNGF